jgi:nickel/cobalt transporter (NicO) family protein
MLDPIGAPLPLVLGFVLGLRHALDPDHLAAMGTIVSRERSLPRAALQGGLWGLGHTASLLGVGLAVILIGAPLPRSWSRWFELAVAAMLIVLGVLTLIRRRVDRPVRPGARRPILVGLLHGLAGSGALTILVLASIRSPWVALVTIAIFGMGSIGGMMLLSGLLALPFAWTGVPRLGRAARTLAGIASIAVGLYCGYVAA